MREGEHYPELRRMTLEPTVMRETRMESGYWQNQDPRRVRDYIQETEIPAVRITMPREDWERMMSIYQSHYHACNQNPALVAAWQQYRMLAVLTEKSRPCG